MAIHSIVLLISLLSWFETLFYAFERVWADQTTSEIYLIPTSILIPTLILILILPFIPTLVLYFIYGKLIILPWKILSRSEN